MGSRIIHYCVGNEITKKVKLDKEQFILGNLAPDAYSLEHDGYLESHFRIPEEIMEYECVYLEKFKNKYKGQINNDFVLGYYCHLITDNLWLKAQYKKYGDFSLDERNEAVKIVYKDYGILNTMLIDKFDVNLIDLQATRHTFVEEINATSLNMLVVNLGNDFLSNNDVNELQELNYEDVLKFIDDATKECIKEIYTIRDL